MEKKIAYCGLLCDSCPIHLATFEKDKLKQQMMRELIAEQCSRYYGMDLHAADVTDCDGCTANTGRLFSGCSNCEIRKCVLQKSIESCAICDEYPCEILNKHFILDPEAKFRLDAMRRANLKRGNF